MTNNEPDSIEKDRGQGRALVSALADGQLRGAEFARAVGLVSDSSEARATWHAYHVVADVLRSSELAVCADDAAFVARLSARLQRETTGFAQDAAPLAFDIQAFNENAIKIKANYANSTGAVGINDVKNGSANESRFRWKLVAGVASFAVVGAIGWGVVGGSGGTGDAPPMAPQLAQVAVPPQLQPQAQPQQPQVMIRDPHLDALLAAHKQFGGTSALQMPAGFLRNATFENPAR